MHLDPGHGGEDPGACANGLIERDLTHQMAHAVFDELTARRWPAVSIGPQQEPDGEKFANARRVPLANRHDAVLLSIHFNAGGGRYGLIEMCADNPQSARLAARLAHRLGVLFGDLVSDVRIRSLQPGERGAVLLEGAKRSACLLEPLFLDRRQHAQWLGLRENRAALARAICDALEDLAGSLAGA